MSESRPKPLERRKHVDSQAAENEVALELLNTYQVERDRHDSCRFVDSSRAPKKFKKDLGEMRDARRRRVAEDAENNPPDGPADPGVVGTWKKLARLLLVRRINPVDFIRRQFAVLPSGASPPHPNALLGQTAFKNFENGRLINHREIVVAFRIQRNKCESEIVKVRRMCQCDTDERAWAAVLLNSESELSALFRYCMARQLIARREVADVELFQRIVDRFYEAAALQYIVNADDYKSVWKEQDGRSWIPDGFDGDAKEIYERIYG